MEVIKTLQFKIFDANSKKINELNQTMRQYRRSTNFYLHEIGSNPSCISNKNLPNIYKKAKKIFNLPTALLQQSGRKAIEAYKSYKENVRNNSYPHFDSFIPVRYDNRTATVFNSDGKYKLWLSLATLNNRVKVPVISGDSVIDEWESYNYDFMDIRLRYKDNEYFVDITIQKECNIPNEDNFEHFIGVDLGVNNIATLTVMNREGKQLEHKVFSGSFLQDKKRRFLGKRKEYSVKRLWNKIKNSKGKETNYVKDVNHKISRKIIEITSKYDNSVIIMEKLKGIRKKIKYTKRMNRKLHGWSFKQLQDFIIYKAHEQEIAIRRVSGAYTSQVCTNCNSKSIKRGSHNVSVGVCKKCKKEVNAIDILASVNIVRRLFFYMEDNLSHSGSGFDLGDRLKGFTEANHFGLVGQL